jgi:hypothetical protein
MTRCAHDSGLPDLHPIADGEAVGLHDVELGELDVGRGDERAAWLAAKTVEQEPGEVLHDALVYAVDELPAGVALEG